VAKYFRKYQSVHCGAFNFSLLFGGTDTSPVRGEGFQFKFPWDTDLRLRRPAYNKSRTNFRYQPETIAASDQSLRPLQALRQRAVCPSDDIGP